MREETKVKLLVATVLTIGQFAIGFILLMFIDWETPKIPPPALRFLSLLAIGAFIVNYKTINSKQQ